MPTPAMEESDDIAIHIPDNIIGIIKLSESPDSIFHYFTASPMYAGFGNLTSPERILFLDNFQKMSPTLRTYMTSSDTVELIFSTGKEYGLEDHQISELGILVRELLAGKIFIKDFSAIVSSRFGVDDVKAGEIVNKLISQSFSPIIEDIKRIQRSKFPEKIMQLQKEGRPKGLTRSEAPRLPAQPLKPPMTDIRPRPAPPQQPPQQAQTKPEFNIPDLEPKIDVKPQLNTGVQKSLEEELEKVASVIDLRDKPPEK